MIETDEIDRQILALLQASGRMTNREIAKKVGLSPAPCWHRMKRLEQSGLIDHYAAVLDRSLSGQNFRAMVGVSLMANSPQARREFEEAVQSLDNIMECYWISGDVEYELVVTAADLSDFEDFLQNRLLAIPGVSNANTRVALKDIKTATALPLDAVARKDSEDTKTGTG